MELPYSLLTQMQNHAYMDYLGRRNNVLIEFVLEIS